MQRMSQFRLDELRGSPVYDQSGETIGKVEEIFYDYETHAPEWIGLGTGFFGTKRVLVPVEGAQPSEDGLMVPYSKDKVKDSPDIDDDQISQECELELATYYGVSQSAPSMDVSRAESTRQGGDTVTRSEEEIEVGKREVNAGSARLRKWVETEPVALQVELHHEVARVTREPIDEPVADHDFREEEVEVPLSAEKPMVQKQAVAKERIGLETDVVTESETVTDELRKERVEVEGDVDRQ